MASIQHYFTHLDKSKRLFNQWDVITLLLVIGVFYALAWGSQQMAAPYLVGDKISIQLDPSYLPGYAIRTVLRMAIAMLFSLLFTFTIGTWAAKSHRAEMIILPAIDVLQSVPVLTFLSITIVGFIRLFPGSMLGPECASIFAVFTAQAWNMALGFYQSLRAVPAELHEAADVYHLSAWQRFWRIEVPFSMSSLLWNAMISMSASWFFVVVSEAITVSNQDIRLPGIGSYIAVAIDNADIHSVGYAIIAMFFVILVYDQLLFRPLLQWSEKFKVDPNPDEKTARSWVITLVHRTKLLKYSTEIFGRMANGFINLRANSNIKEYLDKEPSPQRERAYDIIWQVFTAVASVVALILLVRYIINSVSLSEVLHVAGLGLVTSLRVMILIALSSIIWVPVGVWIGMRPALAYRVQPIIQFVASFPAYLLFPLVVIAIAHYHLNPEIWTSPLMILGSQWYILFNIIAGTLSLPKDVYFAADNFAVSGWLWWKRVALPGVFPFYITGAITAAGGAWNASIVAEWVHWGDTVIRATGLGEYITASTNVGDFHRVALGTGIMSLFVIAFNRVLWQPLYRLAERRFGA